jgi:hypothetical protein
MSSIGLCLLSIISGFYLGFSIYRIKKMATEKDDLVNTKIMTIHAASFGIYMLSSLVSVVMLVLDAWYDVPYGYYLASDILNIICSSLTQAMICYIFWNVDNIKESNNENNDEVFTEEIDENDDLQMRLWYQFMRDPEDEERPSIYRVPRN